MKIIGTVHSMEEFRKGLRLSKEKIDLLELRLDAFPEKEVPKLAEQLLSRKGAFIITVRHVGEGGATSFSINKRKELFAQFLPFAKYIDVEVRHSAPFQTLFRTMGSKVKWIASYHNFSRTPSLRELQKLAGKAAREGADIFKVAARTDSPRDVATVLTFLEKEKRIPLSVMGMGPFGKVSRLLFARAGSVLNYACIGKPKVPGQWPAEVLKARILELN